MNLHDLGCMAAERLLVMVEGAQDSGIDRLPCSLIIRESCGSR
jgi:LacI family transcriptional regulator